MVQNQTINKSRMRSITNSDLPGLFVSADNASISSQKWYLNILRLNITSSIFGSVFAALTSLKDYSLLFSWLSFSSFIISFILSGTLRFQKPEKSWHSARAIAEAAKTLAWRYMMRAEPFGSSLAPKDADKKLSESLKAILAERPNLTHALDGNHNSLPQITQKMTDVRGLNVEERKDFYVRNRIENQQDWYSRKAKENQRNEKLWSALIMILQIAAAISAVVPIAAQEAPIKITGILSTITASCIAWFQAKRHQELAGSYNLAAQELGFIAANAKHINEEDQLTSFVLETESKISREHTLWVTKRE